MNKKILYGIGILIAIIAVYFVFFGQETREEISFSEGIKEIDNLWAKNNVNPAYLTNDLTEIKFSSSDLESLNDDLISFQSSLNKMNQTKDVEALTDFVEIHLLLVDELVLALKVKETNDELKSKEVSGNNLCLNKTDLKFVGENTILLNEKMHSLNELIYAFNEVHSGLEEKANLTSFLVGESGFSKTKLENETVLNELERLC